MTDHRFAALRREYVRADLDESTGPSDPIAALEAWVHEAHEAGLAEPNAMTVATVDEHGAPNARVVLLKHLDAEGLVFYTNYESAKGRELARTPKAAVVFVWLELERQARVRGTVERVSREESLAYFRARPRASQLGAWASPQSAVVSGRAELDARMDEAVARFAGTDVALPDGWGGFRVKPDEIELWQGRPSRMHDRLRFVRDGARWRRERLAP